MGVNTITARLNRAMVVGVALVPVFYVTSLHSYLLFHSLVEIFSIIVACGIFLLAWNARRFLDNKYLLFIGIAYLFVGVLDLLHTLAYKGMGVFQVDAANLSTQLWIATRYTESISLLMAPFVLNRRPNYGLVFCAYFAGFTLVLLSIFYWHTFPDCFIEGTGLTPFKIVSEYIIVVVLGASVALLFRRRSAFEPTVFSLLVASIAVTMLSEFAFTFYADVYGLANMIGHFFKIISFYLIYEAIIATGLMEPYRVLFRNLKQSERELQEARDNLERKVEDRTAELAAINVQLRQEVEERRQAEDAVTVERERLFSVLDSLPAYVYLQAADHSIYFANRYFREHFGEPHGKRCYEVLHNRHEPCERCLTFRVFDTKEPQEWEWLTPAGETYQVYDYPFVDISGMLLVLELGINITRRKHAERSLRSAHKRLARRNRAMRVLSAKLLRRQERDRQKLSMELHDHLGQILTIIKMDVEMAAELVLPANAALQQKMDRIRSALTQTIKDLKDICHRLRPSMLDTIGLVPSLRTLIDEIKNRGAIQCELYTSNIPERFSPNIEIAIYRIAQESLMNIVKYAQAQNVFINLIVRDSTVSLSIEDDGIGFNADKILDDAEMTGKSLGLLTMKERTAQLKGKFSIESRAGHGTHILVTIPLRK